MSAARAKSIPPRVPGPKPLLSPDREAALTVRQREILDELEAQVSPGRVADLTMAEIASRMNCSLRTLYEIAPSKEELVLTVVDRRLHRIGRRAAATLDRALPPLESLRAYLRAVNEAVQPQTRSFAHELASLPGAKRLLDSHESHVIAVSKSLLDRAVSEGEIEPLDTAALAHVLGGLGREFARPELAELIGDEPKPTADAVTDIVIRGLARRAASSAAKS